MKRIFKIALIAIRSILLFILIWGGTITIVKNVHKVILVEDFKKNAVLQEDISTASVKYYKIASNEEYATFTKSGNLVYPGNESDILVTTEALVGSEVIRGTVSFLVGGHAAYVNENYGDYKLSYIDKGTTTIEATGLNEGENLSAIFNSNYWINDSVYKEVIGLRVKMTDEQRHEVNSVASSLVGDPYNYSFVFDTVNKSYCSDIMYKAYRKVGINLNKDGFATTIFDLISSSDCYISYYHVFKDGVKYIYYLG